MIGNGFLILIFFTPVLIGKVNGQIFTLADIRRDLQSEIIKGLYQRTYTSLLDRIDSDGFLHESLTGRYPGMLPRTVAGVVSLFSETGGLYS